MNNYYCYITGGTGGAGGSGNGNGVGGAGGDGIGPSLNWDIHGDVINHHGESGLHILARTAALGAMYDSVEGFPQPRCHPETRTKMLDDLHEWTRATHPRTTILWLYGPAGTGKSAIMQTLASQLHDAGRLGGCFFFKRGHTTCGNGKTLFATIAYQLALNIPQFRTPISQVVDNDPAIVARSIETQIQKLIIGPCSRGGSCEPLAITIDGLDECDGPDVQRQILRVIRDVSAKRAIPLRFIVSSRPEPHIREMFDSPVYSEYHAVNVEQSFDDVRKYLRDEFARIHDEHCTMAMTPLPWPAPDILEELVWRSSGHFIYASTIIKFIDDKNYRPTERLAVIQDPNSSLSEAAFDILDQLYMTILRSVPRQSQLIPILCAIVHFKLAADQIDPLFGLAHGETRLLLRGLHSVLKVPSKIVISSHHASFVDFLVNPDRSGNFCVGPSKHKSIWRLLSHLLRFVISLPPSGAVAELLPLVGSINPNYIFDPEAYQYQAGYDYFAAIISWLKKSPLAPTDVIQLWEDYAFMFSIGTIYAHIRCDPSVEHIVSPSPELLRILVLMGFLRCQLWELPTKFDFTWTDLRTALCSIRSKCVGDKHALPIHQPQAAYPCAARDLALQLIRKMVKNHIDTDGGRNPSASHAVVLLYNVHLLHREYPFIEDLKEAYVRSQSVSIAQKDVFIDDCPLLALYFITNFGRFHSPKYGPLGQVVADLSIMFPGGLQFDDGTHQALAEGFARSLPLWYQHI
ncbi:putative nwd2 protein [Mycena sanguinolenta]|uniref:Putative nwd2 protein n=1 Tax=Mycena sanguinolenta TaxID=230812 RepID=A0A8H7CGS8_9AGAR|nr:putative nwd2 protein [Mycena sanguinolenta]